ncbi:MAG TPA: lipoprotein [Burkholderiaceae bacterium]|nr:lipoprotein [Burkholderiaceae bacterium]HQZ05142.1 lipoprotein [Burkholderiaceae bacterium]HRA61796.1 lipoprotein [Burkholderiaceae bacterium]
MMCIRQILVRVGIPVGMAVVLSACGQKGQLVFPTEPASRNRATLFETLRPGAATQPSPAASAPAAPASTPASP